VFPGTITLQRYEKVGFGYRIDLRSSEDPRYTAIYAHGTSKTVVKTGSKVIRGQLIKYSDTSGTATGPHLHFTVLFNGKAIDPERLKWKIYNWKTPQVPAKPKPKPKPVDPCASLKKDKAILLGQKANRDKEIINLKNSIKLVTKSHEEEIKQLQTEYTKCRDRGVELVGEVERLNGRIGELEKAQQEVNLTLDIAPNAKVNTTIKAIQGLMAGKKPPNYQQKTPDKWIQEFIKIIMSIFKKRR